MLSTRAAVYLAAVACAFAFAAAACAPAAAPMMVTAPAGPAHPAAPAPPPSDPLDCDIAGALRLRHELNADLVVLKYSLRFEDGDRIAALALREGAIAAHGQIMVETNLVELGGEDVQVVHGVDPSVLPGLQRYVVTGALHALHDGEVAVGEPLATKLGLRVGQSVHLRVPDRRETPPMTARISAILRYPADDFAHYGTKLLLTNLATARGVVHMKDTDVTGIFIRLAAGADSHAYIERLEAALYGEAYKVVSREELDEGVAEALEPIRAKCR